MVVRGGLQDLVDQLNQAFCDGGNRHGGSAYLTGGGISDCCPLQIHVNTCDTTFELTGLTPTQEYNPFEVSGTVQIDPYCEDCETEPREKLFTCGIRVIAKPLSADCGCYIEKPLTQYVTKLDVLPVLGFQRGTFHVEKVQTMRAPTNFGSHIQWEEYKQEVGGRGRNYDLSTYNTGWLQLPHPNSRVNGAITARCDTDYCVYRLIFTDDSETVAHTRTEQKHYGVINVPHTDDVTKASVEEFLTALAEYAPRCTSIDSVECSSSFVCDAEETPVEETPVEETPVEETPVEEAPVTP